MGCNTTRQICTPEHPGYIGNLPPDPSDAQVISLMSEVPYIGNAAALLFAGSMLKGGPVCVEDNRKKLTSTWRSEIIAACIFGGLLFTTFLLLALRKK